MKLAFVLAIFFASHLYAQSPLNWVENPNTTDQVRENSYIVRDLLTKQSGHYVRVSTYITPALIFDVISGPDASSKGDKDTHPDIEAVQQSLASLYKLASDAKFDPSSIHEIEVVHPKYDFVGPNKFGSYFVPAGRSYVEIANFMHHAPTQKSFEALVNRFEKESNDFKKQFGIDFIPTDAISIARAEALLMRFREEFNTNLSELANHITTIQFSSNVAPDNDDPKVELLKVGTTFGLDAVSLRIDTALSDAQLFEQLLTIAFKADDAIEILQQCNRLTSMLGEELGLLVNLKDDLPPQRKLEVLESLYATKAEVLAKSIDGDAKIRKLNVVVEIGQTSPREIPSIGGVLSVGVNDTKDLKVFVRAVQSWRAGESEYTRDNYKKELQQLEDELNKNYDARFKLSVLADQLTPWDFTTFCVELKGLYMSGGRLVKGKTYEIGNSRFWSGYDYVSDDGSPIHLHFAIKRMAEQAAFFEVGP